MIIGGSSAPPATIRWFRERGIRVNHLWGMTEMSPVGTVGAPPAELGRDERGRAARLSWRGPAARCSGSSCAIVDDDGNVLPRDGKSSGQLQTRGPAVVSRYFKQDEDCVDADNWFDTGDVAAIHPDGTIQITDRAKDVIKSGGEWISSIELENAAVGCPGVAEAAAIGIPHPKWDERPLLLDRARSGQRGRAKARSALSLPPRSPNGGCPTRSSSSTSLPHTATGKLSKKDLRDRYRDYRFADAEAMVGRD